ncbi:MAG: hypothetical protein ABTQ34_02245 [Bdellovibrionales bacterium]
MPVFAGMTSVFIEEFPSASAVTPVTASVRTGSGGCLLWVT